MSKQHVLGAQKLRRRIETIREGVPELLSQDGLGRLLVDRMKARFIAEVDPSGKPWAKLSPRTKAGKGILRKTGTLYNAIDIIRGNPTGFATATGAGFRIGLKPASNPGDGKDVSFYGRIQQNGISGRLPARRFLGVGPSDVKSVDSYLRRKLKQLVR